MKNLKKIYKKIVNEIDNDKSENFCCQEDIPLETPIGFDKSFTICCEDEKEIVYTVLIKRIEI